MIAFVTCGLIPFLIGFVLTTLFGPFIAIGLGLLGAFISVYVGMWLEGVLS